MDESELSLRMGENNVTLSSDATLFLFLEVGDGDFGGDGMGGDEALTAASAAAVATAADTIALAATVDEPIFLTSGDKAS